MAATPAAQVVQHDSPIPPDLLEDVLADENLADCTSLPALHARLQRLSQQLIHADNDDSPFRQVSFEGTHPNPVFVPNPFKKDFGIDGQRIQRYYRYAVKDERQLVAALEYAVEKVPSGPIVVHPSSNGAAQDPPPPPGTREVLPPPERTLNIFLGGFKAVGNLEFLRKHNIRKIVTAAAGIERVFPAFGKMVDRAKADGVVFCELDWIDSTEQDLFAGGQMAKALAFMNESAISTGESDDGGHAVLVHCAQGRSRSASVVVAYFMQGGVLKYDEALDVVRGARAMAQPNPAFEAQLREWGKQFCG